MDRSSALRSIMRARRLRGRYLPADLFADPAWDMLLDLLSASLECRRVDVTCLCAASAVPHATAHRWIGIMVERGLIERSSDPDDQRRVYLELSEETFLALGEWLEQAAQSQLVAA